MNIINNFGTLWFLLPFFKSSLIKNKLSLILSVLFGFKIYKLKLSNTFTISTPSSKFPNILYFLGILSYAYFYRIKDNNEIELSFDSKNIITIPTTNLTSEDDNLLELLFLGIKYGVNFIFGDKNDNEDLRDNTIRVYENDGRKILEVFNGIKFYLDSVHTSVSIIETFVRKIHMINLDDDFTNKIVLDVGAERGDTALYYASLNATVYSFEPIKSNYDDMLENISLNPELAKKIIPIFGAIGEDKILKFYQDSNTPNIGASFVYNIRGKNAIISEVQGYSLETALTKFKIPHVDLLKTDCKNCELFFTEKSFENIDMVKIEASLKPNPEKNMNYMLSLLKKSGFECVLYKIDPLDYSSTKELAHILGKKI